MRLIGGKSLVVLLNALLGISTLIASHAFGQSNEGFTTVDCRVEFDSVGARAESCSSLNGRSLVTFTWQQDPRQQPTVVKALFADDEEKVWQRLWVASGEQRVSAKAQLQLRREVFRFGPGLLSPRVHAVVDFIANFVPAGTSLQEFDLTFTDTLVAQSELRPSFELICDSVGKEREAVFNVKNADQRKTFVVGDQSTFCPGRCGFGCSQPY